MLKVAHSARFARSVRNQCPKTVKMPQLKRFKSIFDIPLSSGMSSNFEVEADSTIDDNSNPLKACILRAVDSLMFCV